MRVQSGVGGGSHSHFTTRGWKLLRGILKRGQRALQVELIDPRPVGRVALRADLAFIVKSVSNKPREVTRHLQRPCETGGQRGRE